MRIRSCGLLALALISLFAISACGGQAPEQAASTMSKENLKSSLPMLINGLAFVQEWQGPYSERYNLKDVAEYVMVESYGGNKPTVQYLASHDGNPPELMLDLKEGDYVLLFKVVGKGNARSMIEKINQLTSQPAQ